MKIELDIRTECIEKIVVNELNEVRECIALSFWESDDRDADMAAVNRVLGWFNVGD